MPVHLGSTLKKLAEEKGMNAPQLGEKAQKSKQTVYTDFKKQDLSTDVIKQYCEALSMSIVDFFKYAYGETFDEIGEPGQSDENNIRIFGRGIEYELKECKKETAALRELIESYKSTIESDKVTIETQKRFIAVLEQQLKGPDKPKSA